MSFQVSDKHQFLYCITPKIASTNWKKVILVLDGYFKHTNDIRPSLAHNFSTGYFRKLSDYTPDEINLRLATYYKFMFSRHPYERLISAFRNKFIDARNTIFRLIFGRYIIRKYRDEINATIDEKSRHDGEVSFEEFVKYIVDSPIEDPDFWNEHWERIDILCLPCLIQYDFIGRFESLDEDADYLLRTLDVADKVVFPRKKSFTNSSLLQKSYFEKLPKGLKQRLYNLYKNDFYMFGYDTSFS